MYKKLIIPLTALLIIIGSELIGYKTEKVELVSVQKLSIKERGEEAKLFCENHAMATTYCFLIDMSVHSGKRRFFIYNLKKDSILLTGLVSHGCCNLPWGSDKSSTKPTFNNIPESHCSSLGKYKVGNRGWSNWGIHVNYKLHGLEDSNSKAFSRQIVLHSWKEIGDSETYPVGTPEGWGCPAVSNSFMKKLDSLLKESEKPVLMWIYN